MPSTVMLRGIALVLAIGSAAPVSALTLAEAYEAALGYDAQFLASRHELASARLDVPIARALLMPSASFSASTSRVEGQREFANSLSQEVKVPLDYTSPSASLSFRAPLFNYDALSRTRQAYSAVDAAEQTFKARQTDLVNRLTSVYLQTAGAIDDRRLAEWEVQALRGQLERSRQRQSRGEGTLTEVARALRPHSSWLAPRRWRPETTSWWQTVRCGA
jgi:outer membrane protein TolC